MTGVEMILFTIGGVALLFIISVLRSTFNISNRGMVRLLILIGGYTYLAVKGEDMNGFLNFILWAFLIIFTIGTIFGGGKEPRGQREGGGLFVWIIRFAMGYLIADTVLNKLDEIIDSNKQRNR